MGEIVLINLLLTWPLWIDESPDFHRLFADLARLALNILVYVPNATHAPILFLLVHGTYSLLPDG